MDEQTLLVPSEPMNSVSTTTGKSSSIGYILVIVFLLLAAIGLGIWLIVLYSTGSTNKGSGRTLIIPGAKITAGVDSVTGTWGKLDNEGDTVTLYVSKGRIIINNDGTVTGNGVIKDSKTGSGGDVDVTVPTNSSYNAVLVATAQDTSHYHIYGPVTVFTQTQASLTNRVFEINNLNSCNGAVSNSGTYTTFAANKGLFRLGSSDEPNSTNSNSFLLNLDGDTLDETDMILCRVPATNKVSLLRWQNKGGNTMPIICGPNTSQSDCEALTSTQIPITNCQWNYNGSPPILNGVSPAGENKWCLTTTQSLNLTTASDQQITCLSDDGSGLIINNSINSSQWFNNFNSPNTTGMM